MNELANLNDIQFSNMYSKNHENDYSLVCKNNIVMYQGVDKIIYGTISVKKGEFINLSTFRVSNIDNNIWNLDPHVIFFLLREYINISQYTKADLINQITNIYKVASKPILENIDNQILINFIDYYNALKLYLPYLRYTLLDYYNYIDTSIINDAKKMNNSNMTPGFKLIYEKLFGDIKTYEDSNSSGNSNSYSRVRYGVNGKQRVYPMVENYYDNKDESIKELNTAAYISAFVAIFLTLVIIFAIMYFIIF